MGMPAVQQLVEALDEYIPEPERDMDKPFLMPIEDVFSISGRGTVVTGRVERGVVVKCRRRDRDQSGCGRRSGRPVRVWRCFASCWTRVSAGDNVGVLLRGNEARGSRARPGTGGSRGRSRRTRSLRVRCTFCRRMKAAVTRRFSRATSRNFSLRRRM